MNTPSERPFDPRRADPHVADALHRPIVTFVRMNFPQGLDRARVQDIALQARSMFEHMPALRSKIFTACETTREVVNVYLWESDLAARAFFTDSLLALVGERYGVTPRVEFAQVDAIVDNTGRGRPSADGG